MLGQVQVTQLLKQNLSEEKQTDQKLTQVARQTNLAAQTAASHG
jgi:ferritin-like metal-binding protein YciE